MTNVVVVIDAAGDNHIVSDDVIDVDIQDNQLTHIGTCELFIDNTADKWGDDFEPNDTISITIGGAVMFVGFVDDVTPCLDKRGVLTNQMVVKGRNYGRYLTDYYYTKNYKDQASGVIIDDILSGVGDPLLYTDPGGTPNVKYNCQRTKLGDAFSQIAALAGYDYYIDTAGRLHYFVAGASDSGVDLKCISGDVTSNLLSFEEYEEIGFDIKNKIEIHAGSVKDHWTEETAASYGNFVGVTAVTDETTIYMYGAASLKAVAVGNDVTFGMDFTGDLHGYTTIDMTRYGQAKVVFLPEVGSTGDFYFRPVLEDGGGNVITFTRKAAGQGSKGFTEEYNAALYKWRTLSFPIGDHASTEVKAIQTSGWWHGDTAFDWSDVVKIGFQLKTGAGMDTIYIDALYLPSIEAKCSTTENPASIAAYGTRMHSEFRKQLQSQKELDDYAAKVLDHMKDPIQKFKAVAIGQTGTKYVSQTVDVRAPDYGINALTPYIIVTLHHSLHNSRTTRGWDYITEYSLVAQDTDPNRVLRGDNYFQAYLLQQARERYEQQRAMMDDEYWLGEIQTGLTPQIQRGATFPTDMNDGDEFFLTADLTVGANEYYGPALYKYDATAGDWIRNPIVMHRNAFPNAGGEVTYDTIHRIDLDIWYRWSGAAWVQIDFAATTLTGTLSATQLKKGIQPFDSTVFFYAIRAAASDAVTFDIDVNDAGSGKTTITASAGTPFSNFSAGDKLIIQGCEDSDNNSTAKVVDSVGGGGASITLTNMLGGVDTATDETCIVSVSDAVRWTGGTPAIWYADGGTDNINAGSGHGIAAGGNWIYFTAGNANLTVTNTYANAVGDTVGIVCRVEVTATQEPIIFPFYTRGQNLSLDALAAGSVDTLVLTADAIIGKDFRTARNVGVAGGPAGIRFDANEIAGYSGGVNKTFYLQSADGKAYCGAGAVVLDANGITIDGQAIYFNDAGSVIRGWIIGWGGGAPYLQVGAAEDLWLTSGAGDDIYILPGGGATFTYMTGWVIPDKVDVQDNLRIPAVNADPAALANGDLWLRTDL